MSERANDDRERARNLMMAALDDELSGSDREQLDRLLADDESLQAEWKRFERVKEVTREMSYTDPPEEVWENYWTSVYNRAERGLGRSLLSAGTLVLFGYGAWQSVQAILADSGIPGFLQIAIFAVVFGGTILLFSVVREKLFTRSRDRYKEVQR